MILAIAILLLLAIGLYLYYKENEAKKELQVQEQLITSAISSKEETKKDLDNKIKDLTAQKEKLLIEIDRAKTEIDKQYCDRYAENEKLFNQQKSNAEVAMSNYISKIEDNYNELEANYDKLESSYEQRVLDINQQIANYNAQMDEIKSSLSAAAAASLREKEIKEQLNFYSIKIPENERNDLQLLMDFKKHFRNPVAISKLIWSEFFLKRTNELCNRVVGTSIVTGIYKITNQITQQCYIGQSVNIADRLKQHIKCGLGIDASATNKLYNSMQEYGIENFTFEVLEKCPKDKLNEKEKQWIELYQSDKFGLNSTKGGS